MLVRRIALPNVLPRSLQPFNATFSLVQSASGALDGLHPPQVKSLRVKSDHSRLEHLISLFGLSLSSSVFLPLTDVCYMGKSQWLGELQWSAAETLSFWRQLASIRVALRLACPRLTSIADLSYR